MTSCEGTNFILEKINKSLNSSCIEEGHDFMTAIYQTEKFGSERALNFLLSCNI